MDDNKKLGRPDKYNEAMQAQADEYLANWKELGDVIPSHAGLCCYIGIARSTLYLWRDKYENFSDTLNAIDVMQECTALNGGLSSAFNATITKLVLANHGYHDKQAVDNTSSDGSMTPKGSTLDDFYATKKPDE